MGWNFIIFEFIDKMVKKYDGVVYAKDGKRYDWGQALCRARYGENWKNDPEYLQENESSEPFPETINLAKEWLKGNVPDWVDQELTKEG